MPDGNALNIATYQQTLLLRCPILFGLPCILTFRGFNSQNEIEICFYER